MLFTTTKDKNSTTIRASIFNPASLKLGLSIRVKKLDCSEEEHNRKILANLEWINTYRREKGQRKYSTSFSSSDHSEEPQGSSMNGWAVPRGQRPSQGAQEEMQEEMQEVYEEHPDPRLRARKKSEILSIDCLLPAKFEIPLPRSKPVDELREHRFESQSDDAISRTSQVSSSSSRSSKIKKEMPVKLEVTSPSSHQWMKSSDGTDSPIVESRIEFNLQTESYNGTPFVDLDEDTAEAIYLNTEMLEGKIFQASIPELRKAGAGGDDQLLVSYTSKGEMMLGKFRRRNLEDFLEYDGYAGAADVNEESEKVKENERVKKRLVLEKIKKNMAMRKQRQMIREKRGRARKTMSQRSTQERMGGEERLVGSQGDNTQN